MQEVLNFIIVLVVDVCIAGSVATLYALGLRLWARGAADSEGGEHLAPRAGAACCFACCVAIVLFALYLIIPAFH